MKWQCEPRQAPSRSRGPHCLGNQHWRQGVDVSGILAAAAQRCLSRCRLAGECGRRAVPKPDNHAVLD